MSPTASRPATGFDVVIGLEVHVQLATRTKIFCGCETAFAAPPNTRICPVCAGLPGTLPVLNRRAFELAVRAAVALGGTVSPVVKFDRKNYFYPDLPKNYQISQYDLPVGRGGHVEITTPEGPKRVRLVRAHLEEDAGKLIHDAERRSSFVDYNRAGTPLLEIVSEPELKSPDEAYAYLVNLKALLKAIGVSDVDMEKGQLRCDANVSIRRGASDPLGPKVEIKNLNSFRFVREALAHEIERQARALAAGERIVQETRLWDDAARRTAAMRSKEEAHDYRYFPEPDLVPFEVDPELVRRTASMMPELPEDRKRRFREAFSLSPYDAEVLLGDDALAALFERLAPHAANAKTLANWIMGPVLAWRNEKGGAFGPECDAGLLELMKLVDDGAVSFKAAKEQIFPEFLATGKAPRRVLEEKGLAQISDRSGLEEALKKVLAAHGKVVQDYLGGKDGALMFLVGQVMRETKGKANPHLVNELIRERLKR